MPFWTMDDPEGKVINADVTSARGLASRVGGGLTSYIHDGMFVTRAVAGAGSAPNDDSWLYRPGVGYTDPGGDILGGGDQRGGVLPVRPAEAPRTGQPPSRFHGNPPTRGPG